VAQQAFLDSVETEVDRTITQQDMEKVIKKTRRSVTSGQLKKFEKYLLQQL